MNDFTKEELETLFHGLKHSNIHDWDIGEKIKSMIDNYCEHEPHGDFHICVDKCKKCGVIL